MIHIEEEVKFDSNLNIMQIAMECLEETCNFIKCDYSCDVELLIVDEEGIHNINKYTRGIDKATDVLSFPYEECPKPGVLPKEEELDFHPESGELLLGQIVICGPICIKQAEEYGHSVAREFAFLLTHSLLHLFGYDHMEKDEEEQMCKAQEEILNKLGYTRD